ncbi:MAG: hypothetical protein AMJ43_01035 [Coxiella sp. DG_40]|nr:MAG: hypothetical protein AMJ43_01035 [Coxiella sp. DG_40]
MFKFLLLLFCVFLVPFAYADMRDPTCPPGMNSSYAETFASDLQIKSIIILPHKRSVVIGDRHLTIGDKIMGASIVAIDKDTVTLQGKNGRFTIAMFHPIVKNFISKKGETK